MSAATALGVLGLLAACTSTPIPPDTERVGERPSWVVQPTRSGSVVYGSGGSPLDDNLAASQSRARQAATADLMTGLRVRIMAETRSEVTEADGAVSRLYSQSVSSRVDDIELDDVQLEDTWESPDGFLYVLVSLDTARAAERLQQAWRDDLPAMAEPTASELDGTGLWARFTAWQRVMTVVGRQQARDQLHRLFAGRAVDPDWPELYQSRRQQYAAIVDDISLYLDARDATGQDNRTVLTAPWTERGLGFVDQPAAADWTLRLSTRRENSQLEHGHQVLLTVNAELVDELGQIRWQTSTQRRGLGGSSDRALRQALNSAAEDLVTAWINSLNP